METLLIALGGNALLSPKGKQNVSNEIKNAERAMRGIAELAKTGRYKIVITHGNGPQVGNELLRNEHSKSIVPPLPLYMLNAETQASIGDILQTALIRELRVLNVKKGVSVLLTHAVVGKNDPAFRKPTKPIGPVYAKAELEKELRQKKFGYVRTSGGGYRRVVASPRPISVIEFEAVKKLANFNISLTSFLLIFVTSIITAITFWLSARVYKHGSVATSSSVYTALPMFFVTVFAFLFLGEQLTSIQYISIGVLVLATYLILFRGKSPFKKEKYIHWLLLGSLLSSVSIIIFKYILTSVSPYTYLVLSNIIIAAFMMVAMQLEHGGIREIAGNMRRYKKAIISASVLAVSYRITFYLAASLAAISLVWPVRNVPNIFIIVFSSNLLFNEHHILRKAALAMIMVISVYFMVFAI